VMLGKCRQASGESGCLVSISGCLGCHALKCSRQAPWH
jgi:hypothetical protein